MTVVAGDPDTGVRATAGAQGLTVLAEAVEVLPAEILGQNLNVVTMTYLLEPCRRPEAALGNVQTLLAGYGLFHVEVSNCVSRYFERYT